MNKANLVAALLLTFFSITDTGWTRPATSQSASDGPQLKIGGGVSTPLELSADDLKRLQRQNLRVLDPHTHKTEVYESVAIHDLLHRAGVPEGENFRGAAMTTYVVAEGTDGYRVVFSAGRTRSGNLGLGSPGRRYHERSTSRRKARPVPVGRAARQARRALGAHAQISNRQPSQQINFSWSCGAQPRGSLAAPSIYPARTICTGCSPKPPQ